MKKLVTDKIYQEDIRQYALETIPKLDLNIGRYTIADEEKVKLYNVRNEYLI